MRSSRRGSYKRRLTGGLRGQSSQASDRTITRSQLGPPVSRMHNKYFSGRMGKSPETRFLDRQHKKRMQQQAYNRGWTASAIPGPRRAATGGRRSTSQDIQTGRSGRGRITQAVMPYKQLVDAIFPILRQRFEGYGFTAGRLLSNIGQQAVDQQVHLDYNAINAWYAKSLDAQNVASNTFIPGSSQVDWTFNYLGGKVTYLIANTCSHTMQVEMLQIKSKRYQNIDPITRWDTDLANDNTLQNVQAPIQTVDISKNTLNQRPGRGGVRNNGFREYYQVLTKKRYILEPGQNVYHTVHLAPFRMTGKQLSTQLTGGIAATQSPKTQYTMIITKCLTLVCDGADADVNVGGSACVITQTQTHQYRAGLLTKPFQTYNQSLLPNAAAFATQQEFNVETEGLETYTETS